MFYAHLLPLKPVLNDSKSFKFYAKISQNPHDFDNHLKLLDYLKNRLLAVCDSSRGYRFDIDFVLDDDNDTDANAVTNVLESILLMPPTGRCSVLKIKIYGEGKNQLPVEAISNWLEESVDRMQINALTPKEKYLKIRLNGIQNAVEMLERLKMVYLIDFINNFHADRNLFWMHCNY